MNVHDRVQLTDAGGVHTGTVTALSDNGMCWVKWDSGMTEKVHETELVPEGDSGAPQTVEEIEAKLNRSLPERVAHLMKSLPKLLSK